MEQAIISLNANLGELKVELEKEKSQFEKLNGKLNLEKAKIIISIQE